jgi:hypothetical protein
MGVLIMKNQTKRLALLCVGLVTAHVTCNGTFWSRVKGLWRNPYKQQADEYTITPWEYGQLQRKIEGKEAEFATLKKLKGIWGEPNLEWGDIVGFNKQGRIVGTGIIPEKKLLSLHAMETKLTKKHISDKNYPVRKLLGTPETWYSFTAHADDTGLNPERIFLQRKTAFDENPNTQSRYNALKSAIIPEMKERYNRAKYPYYNQLGWGY